MMVHFPSALLPVDFVFNLITAYSGFKALNDAAYYCLAAGVLGGWVAMGAGLIDLIRFIKPGSPAIRKVIIHFCIQATVIICFSIVLALEYKHPGMRETPSSLMLVCKGGFLVAMLFGNFIGGEIVLKYVAKEFQ